MKGKHVFYIINIIVMIYLSILLIRWTLWWMDRPHKLLLIASINVRLTVVLLIVSILIFFFLTISFIIDKKRKK